METDEILILGGGIAGLLCAFLLVKDGRRVTIVERDRSCDQVDPDAIFANWRRTGVGQIRHTHAFRARFRHLLEQEAPELLDWLLAAGARLVPYVENLAPHLRPGRSMPDAADTIAMRRTLFETVLRNFLAGNPLVTLRFGSKAGDLLMANGEERREVVGLLVGGDPVWADLVVDAGGRRSPVKSWLRKAGVELENETHPCHLTYHTRFFELLPAAEEPEPPQGRTGDLGYLKFGVIPADNRSFSITLALPDIETALRDHVSTDAGFMEVCGQLPGVAPFIDPAVVRPLGRVGGMADLHSRWQSYRLGDDPLMPGLLGIGDALVLANPLYGRGMTFAFIEALCLRNALRGALSFGEVLGRYEEAVRSELYDYFVDMRVQDLAAKARANIVAGQAGPDSAAREANGFSGWLLDAARNALPNSPTLMRGLVLSIHMLDRPGRWHKGWRARIAALYPLLFRRAAPAVSINPTREDMYRSIIPVELKRNDIRYDEDLAEFHRRHRNASRRRQLS